MKKLLLLILIAISCTLLSGRELNEFFTTRDYVEYRNDKGRLIGETFTFDEDEFSKDDLYKKFFVIYHFDGSLDDVEITYAYSPVLKGIEIVDGKPVNLQITKRGDVVTVSENQVRFPLCTRYDYRLETASRIETSCGLRVTRKSTLPASSTVTNPRFGGSTP